METQLAMPSVASAMVVEQYGRPDLDGRSSMLVALMNLSPGWRWPRATKWTAMTRTIAGIYKVATYRLPPVSLSGFSAMFWYSIYGGSSEDLNVH